MKLRLEIHWLAVALLALIVLLLWPERVEQPKTIEFIAREESEIEKFRRKRGQAAGRFNGSGNGPNRKRTLQEEIEEKDAEVEHVVRGYVKQQREHVS